MPGISGDYVYSVILTLAAMHLALGLAAAGIPCMTGAGGFVTAKRSKIFQNKFGQQAGTFGFLAGTYLFLVLAAAAVSLNIRLPEVAIFWFSTPLPLVPLLASLIAGAALFLLYRGLWQKMKERKKAHAALGLGAAVCLWFFLYCAAGAFRLFCLRLDLPDDPLLFFIPPKDSTFWPMILQAVSLSCAMAGAFSALYLLVRRGKDDFGRDYYNYALRLTSRWALFAGVLQSLFAVWLAVSLWPSAEQTATGDGTLMVLGAAALLELASLALWGVTSFQTNALRFKPMIAGAWFFSVASLAAECIALAPFYLT